MKKFPAEFEALLSPKGRRLLRGKDADHAALQRAPFYSSTGLLAPKVLAGCTRLLAKTFTDLLVMHTERLPSAYGATTAHGDVLPKVGRMLSVPTGGKETEWYRRAEEIGLAPMVFSQSYAAFCRALAGQPLTALQSGQVICLRPGDYAGPHTDHEPLDPGACGGYVDLHLTFCTPGVRQQFIVYARDGHFDTLQSIAASGTVTAYRLPVWHYTTPLQTRSAGDRRWLVLGTFFFEESPRSSALRLA